MKRALVTGAGQRLGRAMALYLAGRGLAVAVHYNGSGQDADAVAGEIRAMGRTAVTVQADFLDRAAVRRLVPDAAGALGGPLDLLVNSASIFEYDRLASATPESWDRHMRSNLEAPFWLLQSFAERAPKAEADAAGEPVSRALCVNMVDQRVRKLTPHFATYTLAKDALWTLTRTAARDLAPDIRVNAIGPGPTMKAAGQSEEHYRRQRAATILGRGSDPDDICAALGYFMDAKAVTGQLLCVDGGQHLNWRTPDMTGGV
ncbi:SDR family oxidoreductase [Roseicyclus sp. F158]|uniref:SDR family oxidoreductase n=1 Tax=Tropicimonas omnivorans TaxID=3075590 RepID=A0ABU3DCF2_9RHOB|nr:SDR family oxidoreductase [Roseicyclus sp. F158]MDT0681392.1 SDR family oxidoreductase [Roseicyclus sp. F158]